ncbi:hypothetical protein BASA60_007269 [Batrachochytrium salamandrivorans]|nr:hypothetical protein BASA60_007269 [Batrachochytrium salamandrivorans]
MASLPLRREAWIRIVKDSLLSTDYLRDKGIAGAIADDEPRSLYWKIYLDIVPCISTEAWHLVLEKERRGYTDLKEKYIFDPTKLKEAADWSLNNPLSLAEDSPWKQYFVDLELRKLILQDVERTLPDQDMFRDTAIQTVLCSILFIWCKLNPDVSYRQGMHELLAIVYIVVNRDKLVNVDPLDSGDDALCIMFNADFVEHDTATIFFRIMRGVRSWYEVNEDQPCYVRHSDKRGSIPTKTIPIIATCKRIQNELLSSLDPELARHIDGHGIEPQLYGLRWLRLLFAREFTLPQVLTLWDGLLADDAGLSLAEWVAVAMLIFIRDRVLASDFASTMHTLMKYPALVNISSSEFISSAKGLRDQFHAKSLGTMLARQDGGTSGIGSAVSSARPRRSNPPWTNFDSAKRDSSQVGIVGSNESSKEDVFTRATVSSQDRSQMNGQLFIKLMRERDAQLIDDLDKVLDDLNYQRKNTVITSPQDTDGLVKIIEQVELIRKSLGEPLSMGDDSPKGCSQKYQKLRFVPVDVDSAGQSADMSNGGVKADTVSNTYTAADTSSSVMTRKTSEMIIGSIADISASDVSPRRRSLSSAQTLSRTTTLPSGTIGLQHSPIGIKSSDRVRSHGTELSQTLPTFSPLQQGASIQMLTHTPDYSSARLAQGADLVLGQVKAGFAGVNKVINGFFEDTSVLSHAHYPQTTPNAQPTQSTRIPACKAELRPDRTAEGYHDLHFPSRPESTNWVDSVLNTTESHVFTRTVPSVSLHMPSANPSIGRTSSIYPPMAPKSRPINSEDPLGVGAVSSKPSRIIK